MRRQVIHISEWVVSVDAVKITEYFERCPNVLDIPCDRQCVVGR